MSRFHHFRPVVSLGALIICACSHAIVIRHDRPDSRYLALGKDFAAYGDIHDAGSTLIAPQWLLTAGHVAENCSPYTSFATVNGVEYAIDRVIIHPDYFKANRQERKDLALLHLTKPVVGVEPVALYKTQDEVGQIVTFMGRGQTGNGEVGPIGDDGKMRGATNKLEAVTPQYVVFKFDPPETATDLEGISGPGDSGGPALLKVDGKWAIVGVSSANQGTGTGPCRYGSNEYYARVSTSIDWIEGTMRAMPKSTIEWTITAPFKEWPKTRTGEIASALMEALRSGDAAKYEAFNQKYRDPRSLGRSTAEARAKSYRETLDRVGTLSVVEIAVDANGRMVALLKNEKDQFFQLALFFFDKSQTLFDGFWIGSAHRRS